ncbi:MAG TPA: hypothetical protein VFL91_28610 [Thermomicrobiales bacterium]|nr:hypothetical protein [Thermomicrobiales bacterium]
MPASRRCHYCRRPDGPFALAAYYPRAAREAQNYVGWVCARCATVERAADFAVTMRRRHGWVRLIVHPDPLWAAHTAEPAGEIEGDAEARGLAGHPPQ